MAGAGAGGGATAFTRALARVPPCPNWKAWVVGASVLDVKGTAAAVGSVEWDREAGALGKVYCAWVRSAMGFARGLGAADFAACFGMGEGEAKAAVVALEARIAHTPQKQLEERTWRYTNDRPRLQAAALIISDPDLRALQVDEDTRARAGAGAGEAGGRHFELAELEKAVHASEYSFVFGFPGKEAAALVVLPRKARLAALASKRASAGTVPQDNVVAGAVAAMPPGAAGAGAGAGANVARENVATTPSGLTPPTSLDDFKKSSLELKELVESSVLSQDLLDKWQAKFPEAATPPERRW